MKIYNTLSKQVEEFVPLSPKEITVYTCGPTVYDYPHIGNWFTFIRYDVLIRALIMCGYKTKWAMNITDVGHLVSDSDTGEDKLDMSAKREGKSAWAIAEFYTKNFIQGLKKLNITSPTYMPRATDHIRDQIDLIVRLEEKGFTYKIDDGIYYNTSLFPKYKNFAQLDIDEQQPGARIDVNPQKKSRADFALWKFSPIYNQRDMEWESPWGKGFPGWHIECSAMAMKYLGNTIDIHSGGIDHLPIHHTNEIAQSEAVTGKPLARYWMHTNHILMNNIKISKSLNNSILLEEILSKNIDLDSFRFLVLQSHYRTQSQFNWSLLKDAQNSLTNLRINFSKINGLLFEKPENAPNKDVELLFVKYQQKIKSALEEDLNTPLAISFLHECSAKFTNIKLSHVDMKYLLSFNKFIESSLGFLIFKKFKLSDDQLKLLSERNKARQNKDWNTSDKIRTKLKIYNIELNDTPEGTSWYKV
jgi:cysteinyl-tRNA synthetase